MHIDLMDAPNTCRFGHFVMQKIIAAHQHQRQKFTKEEIICRYGIFFSHLCLHLVVVVVVSVVLAKIWRDRNG